MARSARLVAVLLSVSLPCAAALARAGLQANAALPASRRSSPPTCYSDDGIDELILYGDAGVLCAYGSVQALFDVWLRPLAELQPDAFVPVIHAPSQAIAIAALWVGITLALKGYRPSVTRTLPSSESLIPLAAAWVGSASIMLAVFAALGLPLDAEPDFLFGSAVVVGAWRYAYSQGLPLP